MRLPNTREDERFFFSQWVPRPLFSIQLLVFKFTVWYPWPFLSLAFGWFGGKGPKVRALQMYFGIKCDPTQTMIHGAGGIQMDQPPFVMVLTPKEWAALRVHDVDVDCTWTNMGGE